MKLENVSQSEKDIQKTLRTVSHLELGAILLLISVPLMAALYQGDVRSGIIISSIMFLTILIVFGSNRQELKHRTQHSTKEN